MKKIGIITFHRAYNYGAILQCYALQEILKYRGHDVYIIDYRSKLFNQYKLSNYFKRKNLIAVLLGIISLKFLRIYIKNRRYERFISENLKTTKEVFVSSDIENLGFDLVVVGSDQVWNSKITSGYDSFYWGYFNCPEIVSYAASMETNQINDKDKTFIIDGLKNFKMISVREGRLIKLLEPLYEGNIYKVLDPTLFAKSYIFEKLIQRDFSEKNNYLLIYQVIEDERVYHIARKIAKQLNIKIIELTSKIGYSRKKRSIETASPEYFLTLMKNAKCIITTSFHGAAFSIIFKKNFYSVKLESKGTRVEDLLKNTNLEDRLITCFEGEYSDIDYTKVELSYELMKKETNDFLLKCNL